MQAGSKTGSIRKSLTWRVSALVAGALAVFMAAYQTLGVGPFVTSQRERNLAAASALVHLRLASLFDHIHRDLDLAKLRAERGRFSIGDRAAFNAWFIPYLTHTETVSSVLLASEEGDEILLLQLSDGNWMNRITDGARRPGVIRRINMNAAGTVLSDVEEASSYDPRVRPWFQEALALRADGETGWTEPYTLFTTREPGITASTRWTAPDGRRYVLAFDVLLRDLSRAVRSIDVSPHGFAALITDDGDVLVPPRYGELSESKLAGALMKSVSDLDVPPLLAAVTAWRRGELRRLANVDVTVDGTEWFARIERYPVGGRHVCIVTMAPSVDFMPLGGRLLLALGAAGLLVLLVGVWMASRLARRVAQPLGRLVEESERIGKLDFSSSPVVETSWQEIERLAAAQDEMRTLLEGATQRLAEANRDLEYRVANRTRELQAANQELATFSYAVSHDLRSPMRAINGFCALLESEHAAGLDDDALALLARVRQASRRMDELIDGLLAVARLSTHKLSAGEVNMSDVASEVWAGLQRSEPERKADLEVEPGCRAYGDPALLHLVVENLLGNAWKYTGKQADARVRFDCTTIDGERVFRVADNGAGFDMKMASKLFAPFQRLHPESDYSGTGIGLATVRRIVELHNGRIWAESQEGAGAVFYFTLGGLASW